MTIPVGNNFHYRPCIRSPYEKLPGLDGVLMTFSKGISLSELRPMSTTRTPESRTFSDHPRFRFPTISTLLFVTAALSAINASSSATSRIGWAVISESQGRPCFSIPSDFETKRGLSLHGLSVTELPTGNW